MTDLTAEHLKQSAENSVLNPPQDTGVKFINHEADAARELHDTAEKTVNGQIRGHVTPFSVVSGQGHEQFNEPPKKINPETLTPDHRKNPVSDTARWFAEILHGRKGKNADR